MKAINAEIRAPPLADWKTYLTWHLLHSAAPLLPTAFVQENFNFYGKTLTGPKRCGRAGSAAWISPTGELGEALGRKYVERTFGAEGKARTLKMVDALEKALGEDIEKLDWMTPATKAQALVKLHAITNKIGYPDRWRDYSSVVIKPDDAVGNSFRADAVRVSSPVEQDRQARGPPRMGDDAAHGQRLLRPADEQHQFPRRHSAAALLLQPRDDAVNFGGIGMVIGHELTHGFDDEGSQFDAHGNLKDWWTPKDAEEFHQREACVADEYGGFSVAPGVYVNGKLTLGENTADNGGVRVALMALLNTIGNKTAKIDGYTPEQRFFLSFGQIWCENARPEALRLQVQTNEHSPPEFRVNGVIRNMPEFQKAFACKPGQPMAPVNACHVW